MASKLEIYNQALVRIGEQIIKSPDEDSKTRRICDEVYEQSLLEVLREYPWGCAKHRASLTRLTETPAFGYTYTYALPADFIRMVDLYDKYGEIDNDTRWSIEGSKFLCDAEVVNIVYVKWIPDVNKLDSLATSALISKLASKIAFSITQSKELVKMITNEYEQLIITKAKSIDTIENRDIMESGLGSWLSNRSGSINIQR